MASLSAHFYIEVNQPGIVFIIYIHINNNTCGLLSACCRPGPVLSTSGIISFLTATSGGSFPCSSFSHRWEPSAGTL